MSSKIYFIRCGDYVQIGSSQWPNRRLMALDPFAPVAPVMIAAFPGGIALRDRIYARLDHVRARRTWFRAGWSVDQVLRLIATPEGRALLLDQSDIPGLPPRQWLDPVRPAGVQPAQ